VSAAPARPDAPAGAKRPGRRWLPAGLVLAVILVAVLGGFVTAAALPVREAAPVTVGGAVTVRPLPGWSVVRRDRAQLPRALGGTVEAEFAQLSRGNGALDVVTIRNLGLPADRAAAFYLDAVLRTQLERPSASDLRAVILASGLEAVTFAYIGTEPSSGDAIEGTVTVTVGSSGVAAFFDGWASEGQLELVDDELEAMINDAEVD
jgi:hypothetical protein